MSTLTDEQRKRIEANRQKALEIRRRKLAEAANSQKPNSGISQNNSLGSKPYTPQPATGSAAIKSNTVSKLFYCNSNNSAPSSSNNSNLCNALKNNQSALGNKSLNSSTTNNNSNNKSNTFQNGTKPKSFYGKTNSGNGRVVNGTFSVISVDRFQVDVDYHSALIDLFKTMPSKHYNSTTKVWDFSIEDHDSLVKKIYPLRPSVCISPLPNKVMKILKESKNIPSLDTIDISSLDPRLLEALLPFQVEGVKFGIRRKGRVLIADDMGLGKTIQALGIASFYKQEWPLLIVTPSSVRYSWLSAIERWLSCTSAAVLNTSQDPIVGPQIIITSYDLLSRRAQQFLKANFGVIIMDESHMLKNFKSARYKSAAPIIKKASRVILLSGTPALSRPSELYTQVQSVQPDFFPNFQEYGVRYCEGKQLPWGWDFSGSSNLHELQILLQSNLMIRRLKTEVLEQLPGKQRQMIILDPTNVSKTLDKDMKDSAQQLAKQDINGTNRRSVLLQYFVQSAQAKLKAVSDYVKELLECDRKFLIFAHHKVMIDALCQACEKAKVLYIRIEGSTMGDARQGLVDEFQRRTDVRVAVLSITAASTGLTLTAANLVVFAELYWNPGILVQAEDRAHRLGQRDSVSVHYLVASGTVDDHIWPLIQKKLNILGRAGLTADNFSNSSAKFQKSKERDSLLQYLEVISTSELKEIEKELMLDDSKEWEETHSPPTKKQKTQ